MASIQSDYRNELQLRLDAATRLVMNGISECQPAGPRWHSLHSPEMAKCVRSGRNP